MTLGHIGLIVLFVLGGIAGVMLWVLPMASKPRGSGWPGVLSLGKHKYPYEMGDQLLRYGGTATFSGMDILLPKPVPHISLSAQRDMLQAAVGHDSRFDIEIMDHHVRLIIDGGVSQDRQAQKKLLTIAKVVMKKVDHRLS